jgi:hypothetical protein
LSKSRAVFLGILLAGAVCAQVRPRIVENPDGALVRIPGTTHPLVNMAKQLGRAPASLPMERMLLHLASSPEQEAAIEQFLVEQQDPASPSYHAWLTPEQFGDQFGVAQQDIDAIAAWLVSQGFQVTEVAPGRRSIEFSGAAAQVEAAFHTEIDRYQWNGRAHVANATDISIPAAFASVVRGVVSLHDFGVRSFHHVISPPAAPLTNFSGGIHGLSPYDFATIYDLTPLWNAGYDGTGQSIAVVGETDIKLSDITGFRALWSLPANNPTVIFNGKDPGIVLGDETEADLDVEWAGAVAKGATIYFVTSASTSASDGVTLSAQYIVQHNTAPVMTLSYGLCEALIGSSNSFYGSLWQQAAGEGIAIFVANGDSGSAGCDAGNSTAASQGFGINGLASTPYNVAVGGTEFSDTSSPSTYWSPNNNAQMASALGYIPEMVWNESSDAGGSGLWAGGGGVSLMWNRASWQTGAGVPAGTARLTPDVSLSAAGHDGYVIEQEGGLYLVGGTSAATPSFAGLMAIVNQYTHAANGNPDSKLYALAASVPSVFHDVTAGSNAVACVGGSPNCSTTTSATVGKMTGYNAGPGYDLATGLGSVDANALVTNWSGTAPAPAIVSLSPNPITESAASQNLTINGSGFAAGSSLAVKVGSVTYQGSSVTFVSSSQLVVSLSVGAAAQSLPVQVTLPSGKTTNSATLTVNTASVPPSIALLSPNPITGSSSAQALTVNGSGFVSGSGLKVTVGSTVYQGSQVTFVSSTQLTASVTVGAAAQSLPVVVTDPNGLATVAATLTVTAPPPSPAVYGLTPNPMAGSNSAQVLTVNGSNFVAGSGLKVSVGGVVYQGSQIASVTGTLLTVNVVVGATAQNLPVEVTNPSGLASNPETLTVSAVPASPVIAALNPNPMTGSTSAQTLIVSGTGFVSGSGMKVTVGGTVYQASQITSAASTQLMVSVVVGATAQTLPVIVTNPNGAASTPVNLTVTAPAAAPAITTLNPNPMTASNLPQVLTIDGSGFQAGLKLTIGGTLITASQLALLTPTELQVNVITGLTPNVYAVQVVNANGGASKSVNLQVSAPPTPVIASLSPDPLIPSNAIQMLTVNGANFQPGSGLKVTVGSASYTGNQVMFVSTSQLKVAVTITSAARTSVCVTNPNGVASNSSPLIVM